VTYMSKSIEDERNPGRQSRETAECPVCGGIVREPRSGDKWICDGCARYWTIDEL